MANSATSGPRVDLVRLCALFVAVAEEGHFGAAADRMGMTQPPVSQGLRRLEQHLGSRMLERTRDGAVLTSAGRQLLPLARTLVRDAQHLESTARQVAAHGTAFTIGVCPTVPLPLMAAATAALRTQAHRVRSMRVPGPDLVARVRTGEYEAALVEEPIPVGELVRGVPHRVPRRLAVPVGLGGVGRSRPPWRAIRGLEFAAPARSSGPAARDLLVDLVRDSGVDPSVVEYEDAAEAISAVAAGVAFCLVDVTQAELDGVRMIDLPGRFDQRFRILVHPDRQVLDAGADSRSTIDRGLSAACRRLVSGVAG